MWQFPSLSSLQNNSSMIVGLLWSEMLPVREPPAVQRGLLPGVRQGGDGRRQP